MSEILPINDSPVLPNALAEYVVGRVLSYDSLNGATPEEREYNFNEALTETLRAARAGDMLDGGQGAYNTVYELEGDSGLVVKWLRRDRHLDGPELERLWREVEGDHTMVLGHFGRRFVPDTSFLVVDDGIFDPPRNHAHVAIQERAIGDRYEDPEQFPASPEMKAEVAEYITRYERMMRSGAILDHLDDLMIDDSPGATRMLTILDTNRLIKHAGTLDMRNTKIFLKEFGVDPATVRTPADAKQVILNILPQLLGMNPQAVSEIQGHDHHMLIDRLDEWRGDLAEAAHEALESMPISPENLPPELRDNPYIDQLLENEFFNLINFVDNFAPEGYHSRAIRKLMADFGISDADLQSSAAS